MRAIGLLADRLLSVVVPQVKAKGACCQYSSWTAKCYCLNNFQYWATCWTNCCQHGCLSCYKTGATC